MGGEGGREGDCSIGGNRRGGREIVLVEGKERSCVVNVLPT